MKRKNIFWYALDSIFVIVFLVFFFTLSGTINNTAVWIAFGAILLSYALLIGTPFLVRKGSASTDYRRPLFVASSAYFTITFLVGLIVIIAKPEAYTATLLINVALFGIYGIFLLINLLANEHTAEQEEQREAELKYVKEAAAAIKSLIDTPKDKSLSKKIEEAYDLISTSPAKSSPNVKSLEESIIQEISDLMDFDPNTQTVEMLKSVEMIISMATKRNTKLQLENKN